METATTSQSVRVMELEATSLKTLIDQRNEWLNDEANKGKPSYEKVSSDTRQMQANYERIINKIKEQRNG
jgi:hypothetical protein